MYPDSLLSVTQTEEKLRQAKADAAIQAKKRLADAKTEGEALIAATISRAVSEMDIMAREAEDAFRATADERNSSLENKKAVLQAKAEKSMDKAAAFIAERIVNG